MQAACTRQSTACREARWLCRTAWCWRSAATPFMLQIGTTAKCTASQSAIRHCKVSRFLLQISGSHLQRKIDRRNTLLFAYRWTALSLHMHVAACVSHKGCCVICTVLMITSQALCSKWRSWVRLVQAIIVVVPVESVTELLFTVAACM